MTMLRARSTQINSLNVIPIFNLQIQDRNRIDNKNNLLVAQLQLAAEYDLTFPIQDSNLVSEYTIAANGVLTKTILEKITNDLQEDEFSVSGSDHLLYRR